MASVSTLKCETNLTFIFKKLGEIDATLKALVNHLGLEVRVTNKDKTDGKGKS
jgi:hypothetical protein